MRTIRVRGGVVMTQAKTVTMSIKVDPVVKRNMENACKMMGISMSAAINLFVHKVAAERRIPFEIVAVEADPFYSESNIRHLEKKMADYKAGRLKLAEHELIEE